MPPVDYNLTVPQDDVKIHHHFKPTDIHNYNGDAYVLMYSEDNKECYCRLDETNGVLVVALSNDYHHGLHHPEVRIQWKANYSQGRPVSPDEQEQEIIKILRAQRFIIVIPYDYGRDDDDS